MRYLLAVFLALSLLAACAPAQTNPQQPAAQVPPPTAAPEPAPVPEAPEPVANEQPVIKADDALDEVFGPVNKDEMITVDDVLCDAENSQLTFRFRNTADVSWQLNQEVPFPAPRDLVSMRVLLNNYEMNGHREAFKDGLRLFGPADTFSENCGGIEVLAPGESVTCSVEPVPLKGETIGGGVNELVLNTAGADGNVRFTCE